MNDPNTKKQLRTQTNNVPKQTNGDLIEPQPEDTNPGSNDGGGDSKIVLGRSQQERKPPKCLEDHET